MTSVVLLVLILLLVEMAAVALIKIHDGVGANGIRTRRVIHNLGLMILEFVEVGHASDIFIQIMVVVVAVVVVLDM